MGVTVDDANEAHELSGSVDHILRIVLPDVGHHDDISMRLIRRVTLADTPAYIPMETIKQKTALPVTHA